MIRDLDDQLYATLCDWWSVRGFVPPQREILPRGYFAFVGEKPVFAGFLYRDERADLGLFIFLTSNPEATPEEKGTGFDELRKHVEAVARDIGVKALITGTNNARLCERFLENGFQKYDEGATHLMKGV